ncbi:MAG: aspartyl/glutamyl-tRNA amidotransferase subunit B [Planctomycetes bacterium]|nr:aspartyl/glutamyl-tRNA amidotransferase subunit B [Planctomycetota bacterium]
MNVSPYRTIIGLEVHVQLLTRTKLFCGCSTKFGLPPNSATCPVCAGLPGALPVMNRMAFELALKAAMALNCQIASLTKWDRKNYFYPDLPKNYQISQYDLPFSKAGWLQIECPGGAKKIGIIRAHLEEDAGKMLHDEQGGGRDSLVDLNRTGVPLLEIVSQPDLRAPEEAKAYLEEMRLLLREIEVSDCEMQEGSLRCDANVNIHIPISPSPVASSFSREPTASADRIQPHGTPSALAAGSRLNVESTGAEGETFAATPIVEIKNLNSFRGVERALKYEAERQFQEYQQKLGSVWNVDPRSARNFAGSTVIPVQEKRNGSLVMVAKATAGWNEKRGVTEIQRRKEEAADYRYFPEPDLVPILIDSLMLEKARAGLGELPAAQRNRLQTEYGLSPYDASVLSSQGRAVVAYFEQTAGLSGDPKETSNWISNEVLQTLNDRKQQIREFAIPPASLAGLIQEVKSSGLNKQRAREVFAEMANSDATVKAALAKLGYQVVSDESQLREIVRRAVAANPKAVADFKKGKVKAADAIKGAVMRETKGMANTELVQRLLAEELDAV